tara:strand:+ start:454 stop:714 length:261 start_codon:yes stop_codon:yes gene_type:complete
MKMLVRQSDKEFYNACDIVHKTIARVELVRSQGAKRVNSDDDFLKALQALKEDALQEEGASKLRNALYADHTLSIYCAMNPDVKIE